MKLKESMIREMCEAGMKKLGREVTVDVEFWRNRTIFKLYIASSDDPKIDSIHENYETWNELGVAYDNYMQTEVKEKEALDELPDPTT